ncbi:hypothetical protein GCM10027187_12360 [Streptosporangium sandarakinum]|uniref:Uncharacterized protein n=1 Tax=Streptosporangium sandarakinum TaxID=1260955 RepID=A0A852V1N0_9ACTN|nr:hypothetical protein [Streptosporangium sandarakinum]NYF41154.1 hypothetical protein [Streptosporangium sandarakinum]
MFVAAKAVAATLLVGSFGGLTSPGAEAVYEKKAVMEETRVACMQERGFTYLAEPVIRREWQDGERERLAGDHAALRAYRAKYGYGVWSRLVYPHDPVVNPVSGENPNNENLMAMSANELKKWRAADDGCFAKAVEQHLGKTVTSFDDYLTKLDAATDRSLAALDKDKELARLGGRFATCLGVGRTKPSALAELGRSRYTKQATEVAKRQHKGPLPKVPKGRVLTMKPVLKPEEAKPYLDGEIKDALKDLECGRSFYAAYSPKAQAARERVYREFAVDFAL